MDRKKALVKNTIIISFGTFLPKAVSFITLPIVTAGLTQTEYGTYDLITTLVSFFLPIVTLQIQGAAFRFLIDCRENEEETNRTITSIFAFIVPVSIFALGVLFFVLKNLSLVLRLLICLYFFLDMLVLGARQVVRGLGNNFLYSVSAVTESALNMILVVTTIKIGNLGITGLLFSLASATMAGLLLLLAKGGILSRIHLPLFSAKKLKELLNYSLPLVPTVLSDWILRLSDRLVITFFMGLEATAIYAVANKIPTALTLVQNTFTYAWQENASLAARDDDEDEYYSAMFETILQILSGATAILLAATPVIFAVLVKGNYGEAYQQMPLLILGMFFSIFSAFIGGIYVAHKKTKSMAVTTLIAAGINLAVDLLLIQYIGIYAASISTLVSYVFLTLYRMIDIRKEHAITYRLKSMGVYLLILGCMCFLCWLQQPVLNVLNAVIALVFAFVVNKRLIISIGKKILEHRKN